MSFVCLAEFGRAGSRIIYGRGPDRWILAALVALAGVGGLAGLTGLFASTRYALGLVGGLWAAAALFLAAKTDPAGARPLQTGALGMVVYALAAGLLVAPAPFFPASWLNNDSFLAVTGVPIQLLRGLIALSVSVSLSFCALTSLAREQHFRIWLRHLMMGAMAGFAILLIMGWFFTYYLGNIATQDKQADYEHDLEMVRLSWMDKILEAERLVKILSSSPLILPALTSRTLENIDQANAFLDVFSETAPESVLLFNGPAGPDHSILQSRPSRLLPGQIICLPTLFSSKLFRGQMADIGPWKIPPMNCGITPVFRCGIKPGKS